MAARKQKTADKAVFKSCSLQRESSFPATPEPAFSVSTLAPASTQLTGSRRGRAASLGPMSPSDSSREASPEPLSISSQNASLQPGLPPSLSGAAPRDAADVLSTPTPTPLQERSRVAGLQLQFADVPPTPTSNCGVGVEGLLAIAMKQRRQAEAARVEAELAWLQLGSPRSLPSARLVEKIAEAPQPRLPGAFPAPHLPSEAKVQYEQMPASVSSSNASVKFDGAWVQKVRGEKMPRPGSTSDSSSNPPSSEASSEEENHGTHSDEQAQVHRTDRLMHETSPLSSQNPVSARTRSLYFGKQPAGSRMPPSAAEFLRDTEPERPSFVPALDLAKAKALGQMRLSRQEAGLGHARDSADSAFDEISVCRARAVLKPFKPVLASGAAANKASGRYKSCDVTAMCDEAEEDGEAIVDLPADQPHLEDAGVEELLMRREMAAQERSRPEPEPFWPSAANWFEKPKPKPKTREFCI